MAVAVQGDLHCKAECFLIHLFVVAERNARLLGLQIIHASENQSGQFVAGVAAVRFHAAEDNMHV